MGYHVTMQRAPKHTWVEPPYCSRLDRHFVPVKMQFAGALGPTRAFICPCCHAKRTITVR